MAGPATAYQVGTHASRPANGAGCVLYSCTDHGLVYLDNGSSWSTLITLTSGLSNPMTTQGDIIQSSDGSGTPARLAKGTTGSYLRAGASSVEYQKNNLAATAAPAGTDDNTAGYSVGSAWFDTTNDEVHFCIDATTSTAVWKQVGAGSGLSTGSSFPGSPSTGDRYRRSDIDYLVFYYDGTRWVSEQLFTADFQTNGQTTNGDFNRQQRVASWPTYDMYIVRANGGGRVSTTNNGSHYWNVRLYKYDGSYTALTGGWATSGDTVDVWTKHDQTSIGTVVSGASKLTTSADVSGSPGALHAFLTVFYRIIAT